MQLDAHQGSFSRSGRDSSVLRPRPDMATAERRASAAWRDAMVVAALTAAAAGLFPVFNLSELLSRLSAPWERFQLDELPGVLCVLALCLAWFAVRRYRDAGTELLRRRAAEERLAAALADNRRLAEQYVRRQEAESKALAQELHDELGQYLNVIKLDAVAIRDGRLASVAAMRERAGAVVETCDRVHAAVASLVRRLRPVGLDELGLAAAVEHCLAAWRGRLPDVELHLETGGELASLPEPVALTSYRLVQEALTNVAKHSSAEHVTVELDRRRDDGAGADVVSITVSDDGVGADPDAPTQGLGLIGMRERVSALEGELQVASTPGRGFRLAATIPVCEAA